MADFTTPIVKPSKKNTLFDQPQGELINPVFIIASDGTVKVHSNEERTRAIHKLLRDYMDVLESEGGRIQFSFPTAHGTTRTVIWQKNHRPLATRKNLDDFKNMFGSLSQTKAGAAVAAAYDDFRVNHERCFYCLHSCTEHLCSPRASDHEFFPHVPSSLRTVKSLTKSADSRQAHALYAQTLRAAFCTLLSSYAE